MEDREMKGPVTLNQTTAEKNEEVPRIRTYESDVAEAMKKNSVSRADIALAEGERRRMEPLPSTLEGERESTKILRISTDLPEGGFLTQFFWRKIAIWSGGLLFLMGIGILLYYGYLWSKGVSRTEKIFVIETPSGRQTDFIFEEKETRTGFIQKIKTLVEKIDVPLNEARTFAITIEESPLTPEKLLAVLNTTAPPSLSRALDASLTIGVHSSRGNQLFILIPVRSYENAFESMLSWEKTLLYDVGPLFNVNVQELSLQPEATTTEKLSASPPFKDTVIRNKNVRAIFEQTGTIVFLYSFLDKDTLLLTTNEETLKTLLPRVSKGSLR